jgi:hypothetical protein
LNIAAETSRPFDHAPLYENGLDFSKLVAVRSAHETQRAKKSVRTHSKDDGIAGNGASSKEPSVREKIEREMQRVLKEEQDQRLNTGANRLSTWTHSAPGGRSSIDVASLAGNSANAELAAGQRAVTVGRLQSLPSRGIMILLIITSYRL